MTKRKYRFGLEWAAAMKTNYRNIDITFRRVESYHGSELSVYTAVFWHLEHDKWVPQS
jgi:hypothetical protein